MGTYKCYVGGKEVGSVSADDSFDAMTKAKEKYGDGAEPSWNAQT